MKGFRNVRRGVKSDLRVKGEVYRGKTPKIKNETTHTDRVILIKVAGVWDLLGLSDTGGQNSQKAKN